MSRSSLLIAMAAIVAPFAMEGAEEGTPDHPTTVKVQADSRVDFDYKDFSENDHTSGIYGRYLNLKVDADINRQFSVHWRQRMNKFGNVANDVFYATDWIYLDYSPSDKWTLSGGKQVVAIGGYEYDRKPIDIYFASMFWNNIACYQFGVSATYHFANSNNLTFQISNSPYQPLGKSCYAYNLMWTGGVGCWNTIWSTNLIEFAPNRYGNFIALGNKFTFDRCYFEVDLMNRYSQHQAFWLEDYSAIGKFCASIGQFDVFAKGGYEHYRPVEGQKFTVDKPFYGIGAEYYPINGSRNLRLHLAAAVTHDYATGARCAQINAGLMWRLTILDKKF